MKDFIAKHRLILGLSIFGVLIVPFIFMGVVYLLDFIGGIIPISFIKVIPIDRTDTASIYEYLYLYSQYLNVIVMGLLTLGLFVFAYRDYIYNYVEKSKVELYISEHITMAVNKHTTRLHFNLTFKNNSKKSEIIESIKVDLLVNEKKYEFSSESELIVEKVRNDRGGFYWDTNKGRPFSGLPIKGEDVIRIYVDFCMDRYTNIDYTTENSYVLVFKYNDFIERFSLIFTEDDIKTISRFKAEDRNPESAFNFDKRIKRLVENTEIKYSK